MTEEYSDSNSDAAEDLGKVDDVEPSETPYVPCPEEEFGDAGEQVEELPEEQKNLIWFILKQVRPGMDLSKVVLPTFILEPRSFLDKLSDSYYHADILSEAVLEEDPFARMRKVVQWYMSGFYKKPRGLKKPYNPILGETFRCYWPHPNGSRTYYIAEQVSHHPPISAFYVTNRHDGFCISCNILAKSKFYGNSTTAMLEGIATLVLLPHDESYLITTPYFHCKGILMGSLSTELGGKIYIDCVKTGYKTEIEFKLKSFYAGSEATNSVNGTIKFGKETLATISGHWDTETRIKDTKSSIETILFSVTPETKQKRLMRYCVLIDSQEPMESERLWHSVSAAIRDDDQKAATEEKTILEEMQRKAAQENSSWVPNYFQQNLIPGQWIYKYADLRPWDPSDDIIQYESKFRVLTRNHGVDKPCCSIVAPDALKIIKSTIEGSKHAAVQEPVWEMSGLIWDATIIRSVLYVIVGISIYFICVYISKE